MAARRDRRRTPEQPRAPRAWGRGRRTTRGAGHHVDAHVRHPLAGADLRPPARDRVRVAIHAPGVRDPRHRRGGAAEALTDRRRGDRLCGQHAHRTVHGDREVPRGEAQLLRGRDADEAGGLGTSRLHRAVRRTRGVYCGHLASAHLRRDAHGERAVHLEGDVQRRGCGPDAGLPEGLAQEGVHRQPRARPRVGLDERALRGLHPEQVLQSSHEDGRDAGRATTARRCSATTAA